MIVIENINIGKITIDTSKSDNKEKEIEDLMYQVDELRTIQDSMKHNQGFVRTRAAPVFSSLDSGEFAGKLKV